MLRRVLITGGAGFIGSHTAFVLLKQGYELVVLDIVKGFEQATGLPIPYEFVERRPVDVPKLEGCPQKAKDILGWSAQRALAQMCREGWAWQQANPMGYRSF